MAQIETPSSPECQESVPSPGGQREEEHGIVHHVQIDKKNMKNTSHNSKILGLSQKKMYIGLNARYQMFNVSNAKIHILI